MKKKAQVYLLDTEQTTGLVKQTISNEDKLFNISLKNRVGEWNYQHLYFTSDEEIKKGDWYLNITDNSIKQASDWIYVSTCKKIVATTNPELWLMTATSGSKGPVFKIPRIGDDFVEAYIKAYNEGKPITEVNLEYEEYNTRPDLGDFLYNPQTDSHGPLMMDRIKLRSNGTVIISNVVEKMYSRDELLDIIADYEMRMSGYKEKSKEWYKTRIDSWLRNHYPQ